MGKFVKHPEYLKVGQRLVFREGRTKAVGNVTKLTPHIPLSGDKEKGQNRSGHSKPQKMMSLNQRKRDEEPTPSVPLPTAAAVATPAATTPKRYMTDLTYQPYIFECKRIPNKH